MLQDSFLTGQQDMQARALAEARLDADRMILAINSAVKVDANLLSSDEQVQVGKLIADVANARAFDDVISIEAATKELSKGTEVFAARRMNRGIRQALAGKNIEAI